MGLPYRLKKNKHQAKHETTNFKKLDFHQSKKVSPALEKGMNKVNVKISLTYSIESVSRL